MRKKYFFIADLLGFSNIVRNSTNIQMEQRIMKWIGLVQQAKKFAEIEQIQLISDTLFASAGDSKEDLIKLIKFSQYLLNKGVPMSLPIKGAICFDEYEWGELTYGKAVIRAHELESKQDWIGVVCDSYLPHSKELYGFGSLIFYPVPMKASQFRLYPAVDWSIPETNELLTFLSGEGLVRDGEIFTWNLADKLNNTVQFSMYKYFAEKSDLDISQFNDNLSIECIEKYMRTNI